MKSHEVPWHLINAGLHRCFLKQGSLWDNVALKRIFLKRRTLFSLLIMSVGREGGKCTAGVVTQKFNQESIEKIIQPHKIVDYFVTGCRNQTTQIVTEGFFVTPRRQYQNFCIWSEMWCIKVYTGEMRWAVTIGTAPVRDRPIKNIVYFKRITQLY